MRRSEVEAVFAFSAGPFKEVFEFYEELRTIYKSYGGKVTASDKEITWVAP